MILLTSDPIDYHALTERVRRPGCGGVVLFLGTVRDRTGDQVTSALDYEAYPGPRAAWKMRGSLSRNHLDTIWPRRSD